MFLPNLDGDFVDVSGRREDGCGSSRRGRRGRRTAAGLLTLGGWCSGCTARPRTVSGFFGCHGSIAGLPVTFLRPSNFACLVLPHHVFFKFPDRTTRQAPEEQRKTVLLFAQFRGAHLFDDPMHQHCPCRGLERNHLLQIS